MNNDFIVVPFTNNAYKLNKFGEVFDSNDERIETFIINNETFIKIDWYNGNRNYLLAQLIAITDKNISLPTDLLEFVQPIFFDGNNKNHFNMNIGYCFKNGPLSVPGLPDDFCFIPYFTRYAINLKGEMISIATGYKKSWCISKPREKKNITGGYFNTRAKCDFGTVSHLSRHRALALTFLNNKQSPFSLVINHKNGIPGDDRLDNIEWVTRAENNLHAYANNLFPNKVRPILMRNNLTNEIIPFKSVFDCMRQTGRTEGFILRRLKKEIQSIRYSDGISFKDDDGKDWEILDDRIKPVSISKVVAIKDIFSNRIFIFNNCEEAGRYSNTNSTTILHHCLNEKVKPYKNFLFRFLTPNIEWPEFTYDELCKIRAKCSNIT